MKATLTYFYKNSWVECAVIIKEVILVDGAELYVCEDMYGNFLGSFPLENIDLLATCGVFNTNDCTISEELCKLLKPNEGEKE